MSVHHGTKHVLAAGASLAALALLAAGPAAAQTPADAGAAAPLPTAAPGSSEPNQVGQVVVTGSRIQSGFVTPTPVTVTTAQDLANLAPTNLADGLVQLPVFEGSLRTAQTTGGGLLGGAGQNLLNLRNLGTNRVLVLLNGQRLVGTNDEGSVDINILPQNLVSRVDVVTGGASAAYGSDAVAGVVNFVLDTKFQGFKAEANTGISTYGDGASSTANLALGRSFFDNRARVVFSAEYFHQLGIGIDYKPTGRSWQDQPYGQLPNTVSTTPSVVIAPGFRAATGSTGGLISSGPLKGTAFDANGRSYPFQYGLDAGTFMGGGDPLAGDVSTGISPNQTRQTAYTHLEFDLTDKVTLWADGLYARDHVDINASWNFATGSTTQLTIFRDNAYLPADVLQRMIAANVQSVPLGRYFNEWGPQINESLVYVRRGSFGARGELPYRWKWDSSLTYGESSEKLAKDNLPNLRNLFAASDAVRNPANGQIVCRSTLAGFDPGCVPFNPFGVNSASAAAAAYVMGNSVKELKLRQTVWMANLSGDFGDHLQLGAGPISLAVGAEYRKEQADQTSDALSQTVITTAGLRAGVAPSSLNNRVGAFQFFNPQPLSGSFNIKEAYGELGIPVLKDLPFVQMLDVTLAGRHADYSRSGGVNTWKYGFNWQVNDDIRLRYTKSRDIRGPGTLELFNSLVQINTNLVYNGATVQSRQLTSGNPDLKPERALTETYGVVYRPSWFRGFQTSLDRYDITITDAIGTLGAQTILDQCAAGNSLACGQFNVESNGSVTVFLKPLNLSVQQTTGYDFEAAYNTHVMGGGLTLRALVNHTTAAYRTAPGSPPVIGLGTANQPKWRGTFSVNYEQDRWSLFVAERIIGAAQIDPNKVEGVYTNDNSIPVMGYLNVTGKYKLNAWGKKEEVFFSVQNVLNARPPVSAGNPTSYNTSVNYAYDTMGRYFTIGLRMALQ